MKLWKSSTASAKFNAWIVARDKACKRCGRREMLQCSHFWSANKSSARFYPDNCITLCYPCHYGKLDGWEYQKAGDYRDYMIERLGKKRYDALKNRYKNNMTRKEAIIELMSWITS